MANLVDFTNPHTNRRIIQAPGGSSQFSLQWDA